MDRLHGRRGDGVAGLSIGAPRLGSAGPATVAECLLQLALHSAHHRGQVAAWLREAGGEPPLTDFIAWIWTGRPAPAWD